MSTALNASGLPRSARLQTAMLVYPGFTLLDLAGPQLALGLHGRTHLVWKAMEPIETDSGVMVLPTTTYELCPENLDVLFVPGGTGTVDVMKDSETLAFLAERGSTARYVTSVCNGSLILGAAGLLDGYRAATHWAAREALEALGVRCAHSRVVIDGNRITGAGMTSGLDFALTLLAQLRGETVARMTQLMMEYDPKPPFTAGTPEMAGPQITAMAREMVSEVFHYELLAAKALSRQRPGEQGNLSSVDGDQIRRAYMTS